MRLIPWFLAVTIVLIGHSVCAADPAKPATPGKKRPSMFARPKKQTPSEQLAHANSLKGAGRNAEATRQYGALVHSWSSSAEAPVAQLECARLLEKEGDYAAAFDEYEYLILNYPGSFQYSEILDSEFRIANYFMTTRHRFLGVLPGSADLETALSMFEKIVLNGPQWSGTPSAQFNIGWIQEQREAYDLASSAYEVVQQSYPQSKFAADAAFRQGCCLYLIAKERPREERSLQIVRAHFQKFLRTYANHESANEAAAHLAEVTDRLAHMTYDRAVFYDKRGNVQAALIAYKDFANKFPDSAKARAAHERIEQLAGKIDLKAAGAAPAAETGDEPRQQTPRPGGKE